MVSHHRTNCFSTYFVLLAFVISPIGKLWPILSWVKQTFCSQNCFQHFSYQIQFMRNWTSHNTNRKGTPSYQINPFLSKLTHSHKIFFKKNSSKLKFWDNLIRLSWKKNNNEWLTYWLAFETNYLIFPRFWPPRQHETCFEWV